MRDAKWAGNCDCAPARALPRTRTQRESLVNAKLLQRPFQMKSKIISVLLPDCESSTSMPKQYRNLDM